MISVPITAAMYSNNDLGPHCEVSGSHGSKYEDDNCLGYSAVQHTPLKHQSTLMRLHGPISQKVVILVPIVATVCSDNSSHC
jgi:hypothetical protein